ncbi:MAG TPA: hypothetical protein VGP82_18585 [Ktedonobacterales bacterium]|nr:hypothetical protein [Ktedonobacterales bacterium]
MAEPVPVAHHEDGHGGRGAPAARGSIWHLVDEAGQLIGQRLNVALAGAVCAAFGASAAGNLVEAQGHTLSAVQIAALQQTFVDG